MLLPFSVRVANDTLFVNNMMHFIMGFNEMYATTE